MALQKDPTPIKEELKKFAAELVAQGGISQEELNKKVLEEKQRLEKISQPKKDQLQVTDAAVEVKEASDTAFNLESGFSDSQAKTELPVQEVSEVPVTAAEPKPIKKPNIKDQSKAGAIQLYEDMYSKNGFEFEDSWMSGKVSVLAPNGKKESFIVKKAVGRRGKDKSTQDWTAVDKFIEENDDKEAWKASQNQRDSLTSIVEDIVERQDYYNFLDLEGVAIKDTEDLYYNHPEVVEAIEKEAINRYNRYNVEDSEKTFFGDTAFQTSGITDSRLKLITNQAIQAEIKRDKIFDLEQEEDLIVKEATSNFNGSTNSLVDYYTKLGALTISNPTEKTIASDWANVYSLQEKLKSTELSTTDRLAFEKQLADSSQKAKALTKQYIDPDNSVLFNFENNTTQVTSTPDPESKSINITSKVDLARAELANLKSTDFGSLQRRYVVNSMELKDIEKRLNQEYDVVQSDGGKRTASLRSLVGQYIMGEGKFFGDMSKGLRAYGEKSEDLGSGTIQEVLDKSSIGIVAEEYLQLKGEAEALKQMYLLNIDPGSVERTGFFGALGESFLESISSPDVVDYYTGKNSSDLLFTAQAVGNEAGIEWNDSQKKNFEETTSEFVGTSLGGLPVLAAEFAVANAGAGIVLGATGLEAGLAALKVGKYYKKGRKAAMTLDEITASAAADGYKGSILSKPVQTWIKNQANITKVGGGAVDQGKALFVESMVEGLKMESVMGEGGFAMGAAFLPAASLTNKLIGRLGLTFKAKGAFAPLNDIVLKPSKSGLVMIPSAEGGAIIEAAIDDFAGGKKFGEYIDENFKGEFYGEGGIGRRLLGHAVAGFGLSYSHLNPKTVFKSLREQKVLRANAITEYKNIQNRIKQEQQLEGGKSRIELLEQEAAKHLEVYTLANNFISNAYALNAATDPQTSAKQAQKDIQKARQDFKKLTGKEMNMNFSIEMQGEGMGGRAASATKLENGTWDVKVDARKYHKGIFGHELGHFYSDVFKINDAEGLGKIVDFVNETVKKTTGTDVKALVNSKYEGKQDAETLNEEYMMALIETLGKNDSSGLVNKNAFGDIANNLKGLYERKMKPFYEEGNVPEMRIESPQELLTLLQRISKGVGKGGNVKQWQQLQGLYIQNKKIFNGKSKEVLGKYGSEGISAEIESQMSVLENKLASEEIDYDMYESQMLILENRLEAAEKTTVAEPKKSTRTSTGKVKIEKIDIDKSYEELTKLREENKAIAEKFGKDPIKGAAEKRIENEIIESLSDPIGKLVTGRTKALFDPIPEDARAGVTREKFQESMRSDLIAMVLNEYKPGKQSAEKFLINRGYLRANNLAKRLGIQSAEVGINKGMEAAEKIAVETSAPEQVFEGRLIEPVERLIKDPELKAEFIEKVNEVTKDLDPDEVNYKNLTSASSDIINKVFGEVLKKNGKIDKAKTLKMQQQFIRNNAETLYKLLPEGARKMATGLQTATGIQKSLLANFYEKGKRADMTKGTEAGLPTQTKKPYNEQSFLEPFGANKGQAPSRNHATAITALVKEIGKAMTNRVFRQELEAKDVSMNTIQKIADGKSVNMASENLSNQIGKAFLENRTTEEDFKKLISTVSKNLPKYFGELTPQIINSANKRNVFIEDIVAERILGDANWALAYEKSGIEYTKLSEVGNDIIDKDGKTKRSDLVKALKIIASEFGDIESLPPFIKKTILATLGANQRLLINGNKISQKATGTTNSKDMLNKALGEVNYKDVPQNIDFKYAYAPTPGKGKWNNTEVGGKGFNGKIENKIVELRDKYKNNTNSIEFREELSNFVRNELTHPELRKQSDGFELTVQANKKLLEKAYNAIYDAVKSGELSLKGAGDLLRIQTNQSTGIFKLLVPYESVTMGGIGRYKKGNKKNTHNEHMIELLNYNLDFLEILKKSENATQAKESIEALVNSLGQAIVDVPTQRVKDSKRFGGASKQVYADRVLNTFLRTNSLNNSLIIAGPYKGYTQGEKLFQELGSDGLRKALDRVEPKRRGKQWTEISQALNQITEKRKLASENVSKEFDKIITKTSGEKRSFSDVTAKIEAGSKGKYKFFVSASADDFVGLMNYNAGKGKQGELDQAFFKKNLYEPYAKANTLINAQNVQMAKQFKDIKKHIKSNSPDFNLTKKLPGSKFTYEQALRVAIWDKQGYEIPGLSKAETASLKKVIDSNVDLQVLALNLKRIAGGEYIKPNKDWYAGDIASDLRQGLNTTLRSKYLTDWKNNVDAMFTTETLNKLEAIHGTPYRKSLENMLEAMYTGKTRRTSPNSLEGRSLNYLNNSVGTIMFLNQRSATLQMLSSFNYINWSDNNPLQAGKALANVPQFAKDFKTLFNSDWAKSRREGLRINVTESEIAEAVNGSKNIPKSITSFLLKKGFLPTQIADSMATALGGATFYRNRTNTYVKEGMTQEKAEAKAMRDWVEISETNQQSSRPDKISMQQRSDLGKLLLAFANTPMQYTRETKKALLDIKNGRGDLKTNLSKVAYYTFVQNAIFSGLQSAVFKMAWSDDEQDQIFLEKKVPKIINSMGDSFLRGMGIGGSLVSTLKNAAIKLYERSDRGSRGRLKDVAFELLDVSPPVSSKIGKIYSALDVIDRAGGFEAAMQEPIDLKNPLVKSGALMTEGFLNLPANRALQKVQTITEAASSNREWYEKLALLSGWRDWEIDPEKVYKSKKEKSTERKAKRKEVFNKMSYKDYQTYKKWKKLKVNNGKDIVDFVEMKKEK